jgi:hypothetical protein
MAPVSADTFYWTGPFKGHADWSSAQYWFDASSSSGTIPGALDYVYFGYTYTGIDFGSDYSQNHLYLVDIDAGATSPSTMPYISQYGGFMNATLEMIASDNAGSAGEYLEQAGVNSCQTLYMGRQANAIAYYDMTGSSVLQVSTDELIGGDGVGYFREGVGNDFPDNNSPSILLGWRNNLSGASGSQGDYELYSGKVVTSTIAIYGMVGSAASIFHQAGGACYVTTLEVGSTDFNNLPSNATYQLDNGTLSAGTEYVEAAYNGTAQFNQTGGSNSPSEVEIGGASPGSYALSGGTLSASRVDLYTNGSFSMTGGTVSIPVAGAFYQYGGTFYSNQIVSIDSASGNIGTYYLDGGSMTVNGSGYTGVIIGDSNVGTFVQNGGTFTFTPSQNTYEFTLGLNSAGSGYYTQYAGLLSTYDEQIGLNGTGNFNQIGGTNTLGSELDLGYYAGSSGTYSLSGGSLIMNGEELIGFNGSGTFTQSGGTHTVGGNVYIGGSGAGASGSGQLNLSNGTMIVDGTLKIWNTANTQVNLSGGVLSVNSLDTSGNPSLFLGNGTTTGWTGGTLAVTGSGGLIIGAGGPLGYSPSINSGMTLNVSNTIGITDTATLSIHGGAVISQADEYATASTAITSIAQYSGSNTVNGTIYLDSYQGAPVSGLYNLYGGTLTTGYQQVGVYGNGFFSQSGGSETINNFLIIGNHPGSAGSFYWGTSTLQINGAAHVGGYFGAGGNGSFILQGGTANINGGVNVYADNSYLWVEAGNLNTPSVNNYSTYSKEGVILTGGTSNMGAVSGTGDMAIGGIGSTYGPAHGVASSLQQNLLTITSHGTLQITGGTNNTVNSLVIDTTGGVLDITNTHLFINYGSGPDPVTSIAAYLASGFNAGAWNGPGIDSSAAAVTPGYAIGYADSADPGNPAGLASGQIEVAYTLIGDADLNRVVNGIDFGILAANFNHTVSRWDQGDFNYDHIVNGIDFTALAANFNKGANGAAVGGSALSDPALVAFAEANGLMADVPEPAALGLGAIALLGLPRRRRGKSQKDHIRADR